MSHYDVAIIGAGPAGLAAAKALNKKFKILLIDSGDIHTTRTSVTSGFGGSGLFSDGKLVISSNIGGNIGKFCSNPNKAINEASELFGILNKIEDNPSLTAKQEALIHKALDNHLVLEASNVVHLGTDGARKFVEKMYDELSSYCKILLNTELLSIVPSKKYFTLDLTTIGKITANYVILAIGRTGAKQMKNILERCGLSVSGYTVDLGIRIETNEQIVQELVDFSYDFKLRYRTDTFKDNVRTFCVCPQGKVIREELQGLTLCNGQSYSKGSPERTKVTNFALLVSLPFKDPINPLKYGESVASLANNIATGGIIVQRFTDLLEGHKSNEEKMLNHIFKPTLNAYAGDLSLALPHRYLTDIIETIKAMEVIAPGLSKTCLLYGPEVKFYSNIIQLHEMETQILNLFCIGDGAGVSKGILQAAASGIVSANIINER